MFKKKRYEIIIQQYKDKIYSYSFLLLKNRMDADDVTQEVFIRIWNNCGKFKVFSTRSWIMKTTHNLCIDYLRKRKVESGRNNDMNEEIFFNKYEIDSELSPEKVTHIKLLTNKVMEEINKLPDNLRTIFLLYQIQGLKYREIGEVLNIPINSVKVYLLRARIKLQESLNEYE